LSLSAETESASSCCRVLLEMGVSPNETFTSESAEKTSPMHEAAKAGNTECLEMMKLVFLRFLKILYFACHIFDVFREGGFSQKDVFLEKFSQRTVLRTLSKAFYMFDKHLLLT
jgi:hypothetical protein